MIDMIRTQSEQMTNMFKIIERVHVMGPKYSHSHIQIYLQIVECHKSNIWKIPGFDVIRVHGWNNSNKVNMKPKIFNYIIGYFVFANGADNGP